MKIWGLGWASSTTCNDSVWGWRPGHSHVAAGLLALTPDSCYLKYLCVVCSRGLVWASSPHGSWILRVNVPERTSGSYCLLWHIRSRIISLLSYAVYWPVMSVCKGSSQALIGERLQTHTQLSEVSSYKGTPHQKDLTLMTSSEPNYLSKSLSPNTITLGY